MPDPDDVGDLPARKDREVLTKAQKKAKAPPQGPQESRPKRSETRSDSGA